jgi:hypothetical protein
MLCIVLQSHNRVQPPSSRDSGGWYPSRLAVPFLCCMFGLVSDPSQTLPLKIIRGYHAFCCQDFMVSVHLTKGAESDVLAFSPHLHIALVGPLHPGDTSKERC